MAGAGAAGTDKDLNSVSRMMRSLGFPVRCDSGAIGHDQFVPPKVYHRIQLRQEWTSTLPAPGKLAGARTLSRSNIEGW